MTESESKDRIEAIATKGLARSLRRAAAGTALVMGGIVIRAFPTRSLAVELASIAAIAVGGLKLIDASWRGGVIMGASHMGVSIFDDFLNTHTTKEN